MPVSCIDVWSCSSCNTQLMLPPVSDAQNLEIFQDAVQSPRIPQYRYCAIYRRPNTNYRSTQRAQTSAERQLNRIVAVLPGSRWWCGSSPKLNSLVPTPPRNFVKIRSQLFKLSDGQTNRQTNRQTDRSENITSFGGGNNTNNHKVHTECKHRIFKFMPYIVFCMHRVKTNRALNYSFLVYCYSNIASLL